MKMLGIFSLMLVALLSPSVNGCSQKSAGTPQATFQMLVDAIKNKDIDSYAACWCSETAEREGMISQLKADPKRWDELQAMFVGPLTLKPDGDSHGAKTRKFIVEAPEVPEGKGIGGLSMIEEGGVWKMYHW